MVFSSLLFVFLFLALNLVSQAARGARQKNIAMLLFSLVFFSWAGPRYVVLLLLDTALCWFLLSASSGSRSVKAAPEPVRGAGAAGAGHL